MKQKHLLALLQTGFTTIHIQFSYGNEDNTAARAPAPAIRRPGTTPTQPWQEVVPFPMPPGHGSAPAHPRNPELKTYTYKARGEVSVGDSVVVDGPRGLAIGTVVGVDSVPRLDLDADFDYKWIVQRIDRTDYDKEMLGEQDFNDTLQLVEATRQREELMGSMAAHLPVGSQARAMFDAALSRFATPTVLANASPVVGCVEADFSKASEVGMQCK